MDNQVTPLEIPERANAKAVAALYDARVSKWISVGAAAESVLLAAAPIIVAAELRRMFGEDAWPCRCSRCIRNRADELDPEGAQ